MQQFWKFLANGEVAPEAGKEQILLEILIAAPQRLEIQPINTHAS